MSKYQTMPALSSEDAVALEKSIRTHGIQVPVIVDEDGAIIDGHHRWEIGTRCGIPVPTTTAGGLSESQKVALSISLNIDRRQLSRAEKREIIAASLKAEPEASNREHARRIGADDKTVQKVREELVATADIPQLDKTRGADGRERTVAPERPVVSIKTKESVETTETFDAHTGEVIEPGEAILAAAESTQAVQDSKYLAAFSSALSSAGRLFEFDPERVGRIASRDHVAILRDHADVIEKFTKSVERSASGLRVIEGGK